MKAVVHERYGEPEELYLRELPEPQISDHECLVRVTAVSESHLGRVPKNVALADAAGIPWRGRRRLSGRARTAT